MANISDEEYTSFATELIDNYCTFPKRFLNIPAMEREIVDRLKAMIAKDNSEDDYDETDFYFDRQSIWNDILTEASMDDDSDLSAEAAVRTFLWEHGVDFEKYD